LTIKTAMYYDQVSLHQKLTEEGDKYCILKGRQRQNFRKWNPGHEYLWEFMLAVLESGVSWRWRDLTMCFEVLTLVLFKKREREKNPFCALLFKSATCR